MKQILRHSLTVKPEFFGSELNGFIMSKGVLKMANRKFKCIKFFINRIFFKKQSIFELLDSL